MPEVITGFTRALPVILKFEGGKVDDPADPGGRTNQGVTQRVYDAYRRRTAMQQRDVYQMTNDERDTIYRNSYWNMIKGDQLPEGVGLVVFDGAVNSGVSRSIGWLQAALGVAVDGQIGPNTLHAVHGDNDNDALIAEILAKREAFLRSLKTFKRYGKGWLSRTLQVEQIGQAWASGSVGPDPFHVEGMGGKANEEDIKKAPSAALGDASTGVGVGQLGLSQVVSGLQDQLTPYSQAGSVWVDKLVIGLIIIGGVLTVAGLAWRGYTWWMKHKLAEAQT